MNRRETLKALFLASASTGIIATTGCSTSVNPNSRGKRVTWTSLDSTYSYGRTAVEKAHDQDLLQQSYFSCLLYTSPSPRDGLLSRMPSSA